MRVGQHVCITLVLILFINSTSRIIVLRIMAGSYCVEWDNKIQSFPLEHRTFGSSLVNPVDFVRVRSPRDQETALNFITDRYQGSPGRWHGDIYVATTSSTNRVLKYIVEGRYIGLSDKGDLFSSAVANSLGDVLVAWRSIDSPYIYASLVGPDGQLKNNINSDNLGLPFLRDLSSVDQVAANGFVMLDWSNTVWKMDVYDALGTFVDSIEDFTSFANVSKPVSLLRDGESIILVHKFAVNTELQILASIVKSDGTVPVQDQIIATVADSDDLSCSLQSSNVLLCTWSTSEAVWAQRFALNGGQLTTATGFGVRPSLPSLGTAVPTSDPWIFRGLDVVHSLNPGLEGGYVSCWHVKVNKMADPTFQVVKVLQCTEFSDSHQPLGQVWTLTETNKVFQDQISAYAITRSWARDGTGPLQVHWSASHDGSSVHRLEIATFSNTGAAASLLVQLLFFVLLLLVLFI